MRYHSSFLDYGWLFFVPACKRFPYGHLILTYFTLAIYRWQSEFYVWMSNTRYIESHVTCYVGTGKPYCTKCSTVSDMKIMILNNSETETNQVVYFLLKIQDAENYTKIMLTESITLKWNYKMWWVIPLWNHDSACWLNYLNGRHAHSLSTYGMHWRHTSITICEEQSFLLSTFACQHNQYLFF